MFNNMFQFDLQVINFQITKNLIDIYFQISRSRWVIWNSELYKLYYVYAHLLLTLFSISLSKCAKECSWAVPAKKSWPKMAPAKAFRRSSQSIRNMKEKVEWSRERGLMPWELSGSSLFQVGGEGIFGMQKILMGW